MVQLLPRTKSAVSECHQSLINLNSNFMSLGNAIRTRHKLKQWMGTEKNPERQDEKRPPKFVATRRRVFSLRPASFFHHQSKLNFVT